jgi:HlyD family secretion protein
LAASGNDRNGSNPTVKSAQEAVYRTLIHLSSGHIESEGRQLRFVPGMLLSAQIHIGTRSVLEHLVSPIQKVAHEAGRGGRRI